MKRFLVILEAQPPVGACIDFACRLQRPGGARLIGILLEKTVAETLHPGPASLPAEALIPNAGLPIFKAHA